MLQATVLARSLRTLPAFAICNAAQKSFYFSKSELKLDAFEKMSDEYRRKYLRNLESCRRTVRRQLGQTNEKIVTEDLNLLLYLAKSDEDVELIRKALTKFVQTNPDVVYKRFGSLFMRLLNCLNKTDKAYEIYSSPELSSLFLSDKYAILPLMDKLIDAKRYDELYDLATFYISRFDTAKIPSTHLNCLTLSFYKKGTKEAYEKLKALLKRIEEADKDFAMGIGSLVHVFLASIQRNDLEYSFDIMLKSKRVHKSLFRNLAAIAFAKYGQVQEAFVYIESIPRLETTPETNNTLNELVGQVFPLALKTLKECIERLDNNKELLTRYDNLTKLIQSRGRLFKSDIDHYFTESYQGIYSSHVKHSASSAANRRPERRK